jgi:hypothetical protein
MRRPSSIEPFTPSPTVTLHPLLQSVLDNLDIQIDEELVRYRRQRRYPTGDRTARKPLAESTRTSANATTSDAGTKSFNLKFADTRVSNSKSAGASPSSTAIGILNQTIQRPIPRSSIYADDLPTEEPRSKADFSRVGFSEPVAEPTSRASGGAAVLNSPPRRGEPFEKLNLSPQPLPTATIPSAPSSELDSSARISSYAEQNDLSVYAPNETLQKLMQQSGTHGDVPEDYLASTEELLRSIAEEDVDLRAEREPNSMLETLLTPLGIGSMLLLLLSSASLGYVMMNPSSLGWWSASQSQSSSPTAPATGTQDGAAPSPDLAAEEFVDLGLDTLSTLPKPTVRGNSTTTKTTTSTKPGSAGAAASNGASNKTSSKAVPRAVEVPAPAAFESIPVAPVPQPSLSTVVVPSEPPVNFAPEPEPVYQPAPAPVPPAPAVSPEPINTTLPALESAAPATTATAPAATTPASPAASTPENYYYVVTEYSGDASLQEARGAVPDAYVRNLPEEGAKVQMGAFSDEAKAQELLQELENQGIEAEVYQP